LRPAWTTLIRAPSNQGNAPKNPRLWETYFVTTQIKTYKSNNKPLMIALAVSTVIAAIIAFYLTSTGKRDHASAEAAPAAAISTAAASEGPHTP
jgi:hypothetical protein